MSTPNPTLHALGFSPTDRVVLFHADDIGCCQASAAGYPDLVEFGLLSTAAVMVPCPWFPAVAAYCRANPDHPNLDLGVHLTLTAEYDDYRWGPISTRQATAGLMDGEGYFFRTSKEVGEHANPVAVKRELEAQIEQAIAAGIDITHIDSHMGSAMHPKFFGAYVELALKYRVPAFLIRWSEERMAQRGFDGEAAQAMYRIIDTAAEAGLPIFDNIIGIPLHAEPARIEDRMEHAKQMIRDLPPGLNNFICHPVKDTPEVHQMAPDTGTRRAHDYAIFTSEEMRDFVKEQGIHVIGYRTLRDQMR
jgi:predicted glycoside hydrolase/deacetylase ChbG (UPF0249 family)